MRKNILCANWKMNKNKKETQAYFDDLLGIDLNFKQVDVIVAVPDLFITTALEKVTNANIKIAAQNTHPQEEGAYTGETSVRALAELGVDYVIVGHSERRDYFNENDAFINEKVQAVFDHGMTPILCVGESLEEKEADQTIAVITQQIEKGLADVSKTDLASLVVGYEPVWAIGSGKTATAEEAQEAAYAIRQKLSDLYTPDLANQVRIQYGGSAKPNNLASFLDQADIDGSLIGGASLDPASFAQMIQVASHED